MVLTYENFVKLTPESEKNIYFKGIFSFHGLISLGNKDKKFWKKKMQEHTCDTPKPGGPVDNPSTRGIHVDFG